MARTDWETRYYEAEASHTEANGMLTAERDHWKAKAEGLRESMRLDAETIAAKDRRIKFLEDGHTETSAHLIRAGIKAFGWNHEGVDKLAAKLEAQTVYAELLVGLLNGARAFVDDEAYAAKIDAALSSHYLQGASIREDEGEAHDASPSPKSGDIAGPAACREISAGLTTQPPDHFVHETCNNVAPMLDLVTAVYNDLDSGAITAAKAKLRSAMRPSSAAQEAGAAPQVPQPFSPNREDGPHTTTREAAPITKACGKEDCRYSFARCGRICFECHRMMADFGD